MFGNILHENRAVYEIIKKYGTDRQATDDNLLRRRKDVGFLTDRHSRDIGKHSQQLRSNAFPRQQWLRKMCLMLRYTYVACLVMINKTNSTIK
jgi:hypothetical protein